METIKELKNTYESVCNEYVHHFCDKQEITFDGWVGDEIGGIAVCSDFYFNLHDIILDINLNQPKGQIINWYYDNLNEHMNENEKYINYNSYIKGLRVSAI